MIFKDRQQAGRQLAFDLVEYTGEDVLVLGIPRGGVPVAFEIAERLSAPLDVILSRKLGVPGQEELAFGAIAAGDGRYLDRKIIDAARISPGEVELVTRAAAKTLQERAHLYRNGHAPQRIEGRTVILVDDGVATGSSMYAAIQALQQMNPKRIIVAVPVAAISVCNWLRLLVDRLVILHAPERFQAVGEFYKDFSPVSDQQVLALLKKATQWHHDERLPGDRPAA